MSKAQAFVAPSFSWTMQAVAGKIMSGVIVATMMSSTSVGEKTAPFSMASRAARTASSLGGRSGIRASAFADSRSGADPLVRRVHDLLEIGVGDDPLG